MGFDRRPAPRSTVRQHVHAPSMFVKYMGDLAMPSDFPLEPYAAIVETTRAHRESALEAWGEFASGWNALCWRYRAAAEHGEAFTRSVQEYGPG